MARIGLQNSAADARARFARLVRRLGNGATQMLIIDENFRLF
jgi:hypothetical protein